MKQHLNVLRRGVALLLSAVLMGAALSGCGGNGNENNNGQPAAGEAAQSVGEETASSVIAGTGSLAGAKEETVYVKAGADGSIREVTVEGTLQDTGDSPLIADVSYLTDLRNTEGDEEFIQQSDGTVLWENHGEDIHYKGTSAQPLPVSVRITYWLDGKEIAPEQLAGKSGSVRIRFDYENHALQTVEVDGEEVSVWVPFAAITAIMLPEEHFTNISVTNGKAVSLDEDAIVLGYALPGLSDSLGLLDYEPTEDIELPDYVEITAEAENFELEFTATVFSSGLFEDMDLTKLDDVDDLLADLDELDDSIDDMVDGVDQLYKGAKKFGSYLDQYTDGAKQLDEGAKALAAGLKALNDSKNEIVGYVDTLQSGLDAVSTGDLEQLLTQLDGALGTVTLPDGTVMDSTGAAAAVTALLQDEQALHTALGSIDTALTQWEDFAKDAEQYVSAVQSAVSDVERALDSIPSDLTDKANEKAADQASAAARSALADTELSEEEQQRITNAVSNSIDVSAVTDPVEQQAAAARKALESIPDLEIPQAAVDGETVHGLVTDMAKQAGILKAYAAGLGGTAEDLDDLDGMLAGLESLLSRMETESAGLLEGASALADGVQQLYDGAEALSEGTGAFRKAGAELSRGYDSLLEGIKELNDGVADFGDEAADGLADLGTEDLRDILRRVRGLKEADADYINFSGICDGQDGSVKFIIETDEIKP